MADTNIHRKGYIRKQYQSLAKQKTISGYEDAV